MARSKKNDLDHVGPPFGELAEFVQDTKKARLGGGGSRGCWMSPGTTHMFPKTGPKPASKLTARDLRPRFANLPEINAGRCLHHMTFSIVRPDGCSGANQKEFEIGIWVVPADRVKGAEGRPKKTGPESIAVFCQYFRKLVAQKAWKPPRLALVLR